MVIAEVRPDASVRVLETLQQPVMLGKDAFTLGFIRNETIEECVAVLKTYRNVLDTYRIAGRKNIVAVATSAIREADNREAVLDRIYVATGLDVYYLEDAELSRYTYHSVLPVLNSTNELQEGEVMVVEVGGGSTDVLHLVDGQVGHSAVFKLGSYRIRRLLDEQMAPASRIGKIMRSHIERGVAQIRAGVNQEIKSPTILALGGDARLAALNCHPNWDRKSPIRVRCSVLLKFAEDMIKLGRDKIVRKYNVSYPDAETLVPALISYVAIAESFGKKSIYVCGANLRDGILRELGESAIWADELKRQMMNAAVSIGRKYEFDQKHAEHIEKICRKLFSVMKDEYQLEPRQEMILSFAALLHEIGHFVSNRSHHKHSLYLIMNSDLFGFNSREIVMSALIARYHRKALPKPEHEVYCTLRHDDRITVCKLAALLRVADALDRGKSQQMVDPELVLEAGLLVVKPNSAGDFAMENFGLRENAQLFEQIYGRKVEIRHDRGQGGEG